MLPAVILSAKVTIDGLNKANSELSVYNKQWTKVAGTVEAAGVSIDNTHKKIDELRAATAVPIVQEVRIEVNDDALKGLAGTAGTTAASRAGGNVGADAGLSAAAITKNMTSIRQWDRGHPNFFGGTSSSGSNDIQKLIQMLQVMNSGRGRTSSASDNSGLGIDLSQLLTGHSGGGRGRFPAPWWARLATGGGRLPGAGSLGSFAGFGAEHFALSLGGVAGSAVAASAGGGLLAAGALGKMAVGGGSDALVGAATIAATKKITEAQTNWNEAIKQYGYYSTQARTAQKAFNEAMREAGPAGEAELKLGEHAKHLEKIFKVDTAGARKKSAHLDNQGLNVAEAFVPKIAGAAEDNLTIINKDIKPLFAWLKGPEGMGVFDQLENKFKQDLPTSIHAFTQAIEFILKTVADASKFTGGFTESLDQFFTKWNEPQNFATWEEHIENLIADFHLWMGFLKDVGGLLADIFSNDAHTGSAIVIALDEMINKADEWVTSTEGSGELHNIFAIHKEEILALLKLVPPLVTIFRQVYMEVAPPLVHAATAVLIVIAKVLEAFEQTGPLAKWALGIAVIAAKMGLLRPVLSWLWQQIGLLPAKLSAQEVSNAKLVASNEALSVSNAELAASFEAVQAAASSTSEAAGVNAATGEILTHNKSQLAMDIPEAGTAAGSQMSLFGRTPTNAITKDAASVEKAGGKLGSTLVGGMASVIPAAFAAYGVINLVTSLMDKGKNHLKEAGFEAGGSIVGGLAGFFIGGPVGAMIGVGLGSLGGELLSKLFESSPKHPFAERLEAEIKHARTVESQFKGAMSGMESAEKKLASDRSHSRKAANDVREAQKNLNEVVKKYGPISKHAHDAEIELAEARKANKEATQAWASAESLTTTSQELAIVKAKEMVNTDKPLLKGMREKVEHRKEEREAQGHSTESIEHLLKAEEELVETQEKLHGAFKVLHQLAPGQAKLYHEMSEAQHKWGKDYIALVPQMDEVTQTHMSHTEQVLQRAGRAFNSFHGGVKKELEGAEGSVESFSKEGVSGINTLMEELQEALGSMGVSNVHFHTKGAKGKTKEGHKAHKQTGGIVVPGSGAGDKVPLTAMVEPGEIVHVLNRNASKKLGQLEAINNAVPRFQEGGAFAAGGVVLNSGVNMSVGKEPQILADLNKYSQEISEVVYVISGYRSPQHSVEVGGFPDDPHTKGEAADIGIGSSLRDSMFAAKEAQLKEAGLYRPFYPESAEEVNHVQLFGEQTAKALASVMGSGGAGNLNSASSVVPKIGKVSMGGPDGQLSELGNEALTQVYKAANEYIAKKAPTGSSIGGKFTEIQGNNAVEAAGKTLLANGLNKIGAAGILGNAWQESGWDPEAVGSGGGGLLGFTAGEISLASEQAAAQAAGKPWGDPSFQMVFALEHISSGIISGLNSSDSAAQAAVYFMEEWEKPYVPTENQANREEGAEKAFSMGLQKGGVAHPIKDIEGIVKGAGAKKTGPIVKAEAKVKPLLNTIEGIGIKGAQLSKLASMTTNVEKYGEYATNAESLDKTEVAPAKDIEKLEKEGKATEWLVQGKFNNKTDGQWLNSKLGSLVGLRNQLLTAHDIVEGKKDYVIKIFKSSKKQLTEVMKDIRQAEKHKREVEKKIKDFEEEVKKFESEIRTIELAKNQNTQALEKEQKQLEHQLSKAEGAKQTAAVHQEEASLRAQISDKQHAINNTGSASHDSIKAINEKINDTNQKIHGDEKAVKGIERDVTRFGRQESVLNEVIPTLETQREGLSSTAFAIYSSGGSAGNQNFLGLQTVQGLGGPLDKMNHAPPMDEIGGELFATEQQLKAIDEALHPHIEAFTESDAEKRALPMKEIEAAMALAELTPGEEDNLAVLEREKSLDIERLGEAEASGNLEEITQWAEALKGTEEAISGLPGNVFAKENTEEQLADQKVINEELQRNLLTLQAQSPVMASMQSVSAIANAGAFAKGGLVAATVGENGAETVLLPNGSNVVSNAERRSVVAASGKPGVNFEKIEFHEADNRVTGRANGRAFDTEAEITKVTRKQATTATRSRTPGGATR